MKFKVLGRFDKPAYNAKSRAYLNLDNWNDYSFVTLYSLVYVDENSTKHDIGAVKIGYFGQKEGSSERRLNEGNEFEKLDSDFFSLGQSDTYYAELNTLGESIRDEILNALNDIAKLPDVYEKAINEEVTKTSLLRFVSETSVTGQFRRIAMGGVRLTDYSFDFITPSLKGMPKSMTLTFHVKAESSPPTNIHVIIGRNGVGKTHLLNSMINSLIAEGSESTKKYGEFMQEFENTEQRIFANLISVSFSAFDESEPQNERKDKTEGIQYSYIGLKRIQSGNEKNKGPKSTIMLRNEFFNSLNNCITTKKIDRWQRIIKMLESDPMFSESEITSIVDLRNEEEFKLVCNETFKRLSSGHKIVLLTLTRLIETLQEKSLVLIDEPEAHLHPPLLSTFIRALPELMIETNGVAIIATHSPVILQEVPKSCVWKLRRTGVEAIAERLQIESFGENVGILTQEVFGLEVTDSGFNKLLKELVEGARNYDEAISTLDDQLGLEAKAILRSLFFEKERQNEFNP